MSSFVQDSAVLFIRLADQYRAMAEALELNVEPLLGRLDAGDDAALAMPGPGGTPGFGIARTSALLSTARATASETSSV
jgi:hypothetical protein